MRSPKEADHMSFIRDRALGIAAASQGARYRERVAVEGD